MNRKALLGVSLAATFALIAFTPMVSAISNLVSATVTEDGQTLDATLLTAAKINKGGQDGAFGYGFLTTSGDGSLIVATTHAGVLDSEKQDGQFDPVWHSHYVNLMPSSLCGNSTPFGPLEVKDLSFEEPGKAKVNHQTNLFFEEMPRTFTGTNALNSSAATWTPETDANTAVQFELRPIDDTNSTNLAFTHVCVENVSGITPSVNP